VPDVSIIVPIYNRGDVIRYTFESIRRASSSLAVETIVVDDGSTPPASETLARLGIHPTRLIRQENQGLLFARLAGLAAATGRYVLFLDSDDLVTEDKLATQVAAMDHDQADVSYTDTARTTLTGDYDALKIAADPPPLVTSDAAEFHIDVQPAPHSPMFRLAYLNQVVAGAYFPASPLYNSVAEIWFYHNAAPRPGRVLYVPGPRAIVGEHPHSRLTNQWERLAVASLAVMEAFARSCPDTPATRGARQRVAEKAFRGWQRLPRGFPAEFCRRELAVWRRLHTAVDGARLGGRKFRALARILGPVATGRLIRSRNGTYESCRAMDDAAVAALINRLPAP